MLLFISRSIRFDLKLSKGDNIILEKIYTGKSMNELDILQISASKGISNALKHALQDAVKQAVTDINGVISANK